MQSKTENWSVDASANGTSFRIPPTTPFQPPAILLICNILWFISLGLSLTCALIATLLEQWARDFLHRADMRSAPVVRARVFSFLYYGLKRFKMHTVVEIIPLLLHASLFLFLVGLVAFLIPVNIALTVVVGIILTIVTVVYALLTLLPLVHIDCPYRTPLSRGFWSLHHSVENVLHRWSSRPVGRLNEETMVDTVFRKAIEPSPKRSSRDTHALIWTVKSLADDNELEPFLEGIPDALWRPVPDSFFLGSTLHARHTRRYAYDEYIRRLMDNPDVGLLRRLDTFFKSCSNGLLSQQVREHRQICVYKAVWALGCLTAPGKPAIGPLQWVYPQVAPEVEHYAHSAAAIQEWANMCAAQPVLDETLGYLAACKNEVNSNNFNLPDVGSLERCMSKLDEYSICPPIHLGLATSYDPSLAHLLSDIEACIEYIHALPFTIYINYLSRATNSNVIPYRFATTRSLIAPRAKIPSTSWLRGTVTDALGTMLRVHRELFETDDHVLEPWLQDHWLDEVFRTVLSHWEPEESDTLPSAVLEYINCRKSDYAMVQLAWSLSENAWKAALRLFSAQPRTLTRFGAHEPLVNLTSCLTAVWRLCHSRSDWPSVVNPSVFDELVDLVSKTNVPSLTPSVIAMAKSRFFGSLSPWNLNQHDMVSTYHNHCFPAQTSTPTPTTGEFNDNDLEEVRSSIFTRIHAVHQVQFSNAVQEFLSTAVHSAEREALSQQILNLPVFTVYDTNHYTDPPHDAYAWLDDSGARDTLKAALTAYLPTLLSANKDETLCSRVQKIIMNLDALHLQQVNVATQNVPGSDDIQLNPGRRSSVEVHGPATAPLHAARSSEPSQFTHSRGGWSEVPIVSRQSWYQSRMASKTNTSVSSAFTRLGGGGGGGNPVSVGQTVVVWKDGGIDCRRESRNGLITLILGEKKTPQQPWEKERIKW
ncbi:hypothetical protein C8R47DRAFT_1284932 [Mycena vitilis]|nr:hypothetical protein C8R47DRAFT_1284932 [Mycena vitilis]